MSVTKSDFAKNLQKLRHEKGWTLKELADKLGVQKQAIDEYEKGVNYPYVERLILMSELFGVSTDFLLGKTYDAVIAMEGLNESQRDFIVKHAESLRLEFLKTKK